MTIAADIPQGSNEPPAAVRLPVAIEGHRLATITRRIRRYSCSLSTETGGPFELSALAIDSGELPPFVFPYLEGAEIHTGNQTRPVYPLPAGCNTFIWDRFCHRSCAPSLDVYRADQIKRFAMMEQRLEQEARVVEWLRANMDCDKCPI